MSADPFVHPTAEVSPAARVGEGTRIWNNAHIREGASVGRECTIGKDVYIDKDVTIGDRVKIQNGALLYRPLLIEDGVFIGPQVVFTNDRHPRAVTAEGIPKSESDWPQELTTVRVGAALGTHAIVLPGVTVGAWAMIGAGSLVVSDVPDYALVLGSPGRRRAWVCTCGAGLPDKRALAECPSCGRTYDTSSTPCRKLTAE